MSAATIIEGDNRETLATLPAGYFHCCVTSPPYYGLRDYGVAGQIGLEPTPGEFVEALVSVFRGVWRVLRDDAVAWLNLGDSYAGSWGAQSRGDFTPGTLEGASKKETSLSARQIHAHPKGEKTGSLKNTPGLKPKDLIGVPWRVAFALQADGWYLRDAIIWQKPAPMPTSQLDRCTASYEMIFQLTKSRRYFFDLDAIKEKTSAPRNVWTIANDGFKGKHFATYPVALPLRCIKATTSAIGCCPSCGAAWERSTTRKPLKRKRPNDITKRSGADGTGNHCPNTVAGVETKTVGWKPRCECEHAPPVACRVLDPFNGAGTTGVACRRLGVDYTGCELNPEYIELSRQRFAKEANRGSTHKGPAPAPNQTSLFA